MKPTNVLLLDQKVKELKTDIKMNRRPMTKLATEFTDLLGFKVSVNSLRDILHANGIETRARSRTDLQLEAFAEDNRNLRGLLTEIAPHSPKAPPHLLNRIKVATEAPEPTPQPKMVTA